MQLSLLSRREMPKKLPHPASILFPFGAKVVTSVDIGPCQLSLPNGVRGGERQKGKPGTMATAEEKQPELAKVAHCPPSRDSGSLRCRVSALKHWGSDLRGARKCQGRSDQSRTEKHVFPPAPAAAGSGQASRRGEPGSADINSRTGVPRIPEPPLERANGFLRADVRR